MSDALQFFEAINGSRIEKDKGILRGVSAITIGKALGHDMWIDHRTLQTAKDALSKFSEGIKVKFRHSKAGEFTSVIEETFGMIKDFVIDGDKLRGDLYMLESLPAEIKAKAFEMAEKMATQFGLSIVFKGEGEKIQGKNYLRCESLESIDLTEKPAANPNGLFSMKHEIKYESGSSGKHHKDCLCGECEKKGGEKSMQELTDAVAALTQTVTSLSEKVSAGAATALQYKDKDGKVTQFSAAELIQTLEASKNFVAEAKKSVDDSQRREIIGKLQAEGRVVFNPETGVAYKITELEALEIGLLKFAAKNSQALPLVARATYTDTGKGPKSNLNGPDGKRLTGTALTTAAWEEAYSDLDKMLEAPFGVSIENRN